MFASKKSNMSFLRHQRKHSPSKLEPKRIIEIKRMELIYSDNESTSSIQDQVSLFKFRVEFKEKGRKNSHTVTSWRYLKDIFQNFSERRKFVEDFYDFCCGSNLHNDNVSSFISKSFKLISRKTDRDFEGIHADS